MRRGGVIGTLRNCCFDHTEQKLIYCSGLPVDLQFLPEDKKREEDPDIRKMLLETLLLALKQKNVYPVMREFHRWEKDIYVAAACEKLIQVRNIWRATSWNLRSIYCVGLVGMQHDFTPPSFQVLIGDEPEQGMENLMEVEIPQDVEEKLQEAHTKEQEELGKEEERMRREEEEEKKKCEQTD
ncbi:hypothetical protein GOODEAATRI_025764 [Goodea atripinnis]|uniref:Protein HGH1 C-terminal domain-containing protein n=1 Tax=Goodea atripinnis TaxID=208336 RepID=A0ABV0PH43_9TELE